MDKKEGKRIRTIIPDAKVWISFMEHIGEIHGKTYGYIGVEVQNALKQYLDNYKNLSPQQVEENHQREMQEMQSKFESKIKSLEMENEVIQAKQANYDQLHQEYFNIQNGHDKLRNRYDHLQERFNKSQKELNALERETRKLHVVLAKIEKLSFFERVLNRLPEEVKQLKTGKE